MLLQNWCFYFTKFNFICCHFFCLLWVLSLIFLAAIHTAIQWFNATILNLFLMLHDFICIIGLTFVFMVSWHACSHFINLDEVTKKTIFCWNFTLKYIKPRRVFFSNKIYNSTSILFMPCLQIDEGRIWRPPRRRTSVHNNDNVNIIIQNISRRNIFCFKFSLCRKNIVKSNLIKYLYFLPHYMLEDIGCSKSLWT